MEITVNVQLGDNETLAYTPSAAAMQCLVALGGNQTKDWCTCHVVSSATPGTAGTAPEPPTAAI